MLHYAHITYGLSVRLSSPGGSARTPRATHDYAPPVSAEITSGSAAAVSTTRRVTVNFSNSTYEMLSDLAEHKGISMSEALRQAISLQDYIANAQEDGARILIDRKGQISELVIR